MCTANCQRALLLVTLALALVITGCGGGGGSDPKPKPINHAPTATIVQPTANPISLNVGTSQYVDLTVRADDPDGNTLQCLWTWDAGSVSPSEQQAEAGYQTTARFTPPNYDGTCHVTCTVNDGEFSDSVEFTIAVTGSGGQPSEELRITGISVNPQPVAPGQVATLTASVQNPGGKPLTYTWSAKAGAITGTGASAVWNAPSVPGIYALYLRVTDGTDTVSTGKTATVSGQTGGLRGEYFETIREKNVVYLDKLVMTRVDPVINMTWEEISPDPGNLGNVGWGARWTGYIKCEQPGTYRFRVHVDDGARMKIENDAGQWVDVIPNCDYDWSDHNKGAWLPADTEDFPVSLEGGKWYPVQLEFFQGAEDAFIRLYWSLNGGAETLVGQEYLKPPT